MRPGSWLLVLVLPALLQLTACQPKPYPRSKIEEQMFGPASMRVHPAFTQVKDWTGDGHPDGIEAVLEFDDQFDEPTRAAGTVRFELWSYHDTDPERAGRQLTAPWVFSLQNSDEQSAHWNPAVRAYSFQLPYDKIANSRMYVVKAQVDMSNGRLFDQLILEPPNKESSRSQHRAERAPTNSPGHLH
jgi:hypothetical protein